MPGWLTWLSETGTNGLVWDIATNNALVLTLLFTVAGALVGMTPTKVDDALFKPVRDWFERIKGEKK